MSVKGVLPLFAAFLLLAVVSSAQATTAVNFTLTDPSIDFNPVGDQQIISVTCRNDFSAPSTLQVETRDSTNATLDTATLVTNDELGGFVQPFQANLTFAFLGSNNWSAAGTINFTDIDSSLPDQQLNMAMAMAANFQSTRVWLSGNATGGYHLNITGLLTPQDGGTMLVNRGSPWVFTGNQNDGTAGDGNPLTVTADGQPWYNGGTATFIVDLTTAEVGYVSSLDDLIGKNVDGAGGSVVGTATVPEPLTMIGVLISIGAVGGYIRKRIHAKPSRSGGGLPPAHVRS